jgi:hypothetical protein
MLSQFSLGNPQPTTYRSMLDCRQKTVTAVIFEVSVSFFTVLLRTIYVKESERIKSANYFFRMFQIVKKVEKL